MEESFRRQVYGTRLRFLAKGHIDTVANVRSLQANARSATVFFSLQIMFSIYRSAVQTICRLLGTQSAEIQQPFEMFSGVHQQYPILVQKTLNKLRIAISQQIL